LLPTVNIGITNQSFIGVGPDNLNYSAKNRFTSFQVGLGIPLFFKADKALSKALESKVKIAQNKEIWKKFYLKNQLDVAIKQLQTYQDQLLQFEEHQLTEALKIQTLSNLQFKAGEINYLDWATLQRQVTEIKLNYLNTVESYNLQLIQVSYLKAQ